MDLASGNLVELLNLVNISDLRVDIKAYNLQHRSILPLAVKNLVKFYVDDLLQNQKVNIVRAIGPIRSFVKVAGALYGLLERPYHGYMSENVGLLRGLGEGMKDFYSVLAEEGAFIASKVLLRGGTTHPSR
jgi:hypothetical protein